MLPWYGFTESHMQNIKSSDHGGSYWLWNSCSCQKVKTELNK